MSKLYLKTKISFAMLEKELTEEQKIYVATMLANYETFSCAGLTPDVDEFVEKYAITEDDDLDG